MRSIRTRWKKGTPHRDPHDPPHRHANKQPRHGTYDNDRPPIIHVISRATGKEPCWVVAHSDTATCQGIVAEAIPEAGTIVSSDDYRSYHGIAQDQATINDGQHEWARDADGDGVREVYCKSCDGAGAALRPFLRPFRGVHKANL